MAYTAATLSLIQDQTAENERQLVDVLFPVLFGASIYNRKDSNTLKFKVMTGGEALHVLVYKNDDVIPVYCGTLNSVIEQEIIIDISQTVGITKNWQLRLVGLLSDFKLSEVSLDYDDRPEPLTFKNVPWIDLGPSKKRIRVWPVTLDTLGAEATIVPTVDGISLPALTVTSSYPKTHLYQFTSDVFGIDYGISIHACDVFELFKIHEPTGVQTLPIAKRFDQLGSTELFRYGKIKEFLVRIIAFGGTIIPFTLYFQDDVKETGNIVVEDGKEDTQLIQVRKTTAGQILRIELGPTAFDFHRFYLRVKATRSGKDTEMEWIDLE